MFIYRYIQWKNSRQLSSSRISIIIFPVLEIIYVKKTPCAIHLYSLSLFFSNRQAFRVLQISVRCEESGPQVKFHLRRFIAHAQTQECNQVTIITKLVLDINRIQGELEPESLWTCNKFRLIPPLCLFLLLHHRVIQTEIMCLIVQLLY